jgi:hypothetical protein
MSSLSVSNLFDITRMTPDLGNCHPDYIQVQPEFMGAAPSWEYVSAVTEPTSERRHDEADKDFQTGEADSRAGDKRCADELGGNRQCQGRRSPSKSQRAKHRAPTSFRNQWLASQCKESDPRHQKEGDG